MKQIINYAITLLLWGVAIALLASRIFPYLFWFLLVLHFVELIVIGLNTGRKYGVSAIKSVIMCMLYGYNWWLPLHKQMKVETFTDADFVREG
jgi:peptidoglycan biosynthesis protein MviN/MurJ (putative lipid II flippase)